METIDNQGYILESDLKRQVAGQFGRRGRNQVALSMNELLDSYALRRIRLNRKVRKHYRIEGNGYGYIILPKVEPAAACTISPSDLHQESAD